LPRNLIFRVVTIVAIAFFSYLLYVDQVSYGGRIGPLGFGNSITLVLLIVALGALYQYRDLLPRLLPRVKRVWQFEFFETDAHSNVDALKNVRVNVETLAFVDGDLTDEEEFTYRELDRHTTTLRGELDYMREADRQKYYEFLYQVGTTAMGLGERARAADRLEHLIDVSDGKYKASDVYFACGLNHVHWAEDSRGERKTQRNKLAIERLGQAAKEDPNRPRAMFWKAYAQDELGQQPRAIKSLQKVLRLAPRHAAAKLNMAIAHTKLGQMKEACDALRSINDSDHQALEFVEWATTDEELGPLLEDPSWGPKAKLFLENAGKRLGAAKDAAS